MMQIVNDKLSFWMPLLSELGTTKPATHCCAPNFIESYYNWGNTYAKQLDDHTVELLPLPTYSSKIQEIFCKILLVVSYFTFIIPAIMLIAKAILRCGTGSLEIRVQGQQPRPTDHVNRPNDIGLETQTEISEAGEKWNFPSDHLPIGMTLDGFHIASWNILNTKFLHHIENNAQGLKNSLIMRLNVPENDKITKREDIIIRKIVGMVLNSYYRRSIVCLQEVSPNVLNELRTQLPENMRVIGFPPSKENGEVIIFDTDRFEMVGNSLTYQYRGKSNMITSIELQDLNNQSKIYQICNTHAPGGPNSTGSINELSQYVLNRRSPTKLFMGDLNKTADQIDQSLESVSSRLNISNPFKRVDIAYPTHINTHRQAVAIDHFYIAPANDNVTYSANLPQDVDACILFRHGALSIDERSAIN